MNLQEFESVMAAFVDRPSALEISKGQIVAEIRDQVLSASLREKEGDLWVQEGSEEMTARNWVCNRIARLPLLADHLIEYVESENSFVPPSGKLLGVDDHGLQFEEEAIENAQAVICSFFEQKMPSVSNVLYLTSDAGEGKTTLINQLALEQARKYKSGKASWMLVPIRLGGRQFMRLDDVIVAEFTNRLRYMVFFESFLQLMRMNVIIPALDGFEEVFVESSTGEGASALGSLISSLEGNGSVLVAARKALFEIQNFSTQAKFFDSLNAESDVVFSRLSLDRWSREQFCNYAQKRRIDNGPAIYQAVSKRLGERHPLVTRAVLVHRLLDIAMNSSIDDLMSKLGSKPEDYFYEFVDTLIEREAMEKWVDRTGESAQPLLSQKEHHALLASIAREMWINSSDALKDEYLDLVASIFAEECGKGPELARQIAERLHNHSLLVSNQLGKRQLRFDHEDFRWFFLGQSLSRNLIADSEQELLSMLRVSGLDERTAESAIAGVARTSGSVAKLATHLVNISKRSTDTSYTKQNAGILIGKLLQQGDLAGATIEDVFFPDNALSNIHINSVSFFRCHFQPTTLVASELENVIFDNCVFERIEPDPNVKITSVKFKMTNVQSFYDSTSDRKVFEPLEIRKGLKELGFGFEEREEQIGPLERNEGDVSRMNLVERALRAFMRSSQINENLFRRKLGERANEFIEDYLPLLLDNGVIKDVQYKGAGDQKRYKLSIPMKNIEPAIRNAKSFEEFFSLLKSPDDLN